MGTSQVFASTLSTRLFSDIWHTEDERLTFREFVDALAPYSLWERGNCCRLADTSPREKPKARASVQTRRNYSYNTDRKSSANRESKAEGELQASLHSSKSPSWPPPPLPSRTTNLKELEAIRQEVALCADFTIEDAFMLLDANDEVMWRYRISWRLSMDLGEKMTGKW